LRLHDNPPCWPPSPTRIRV